jgi:hypothetical protein
MAARRDDSEYIARVLIGFSLQWLIVNLLLACQYPIKTGCAPPAANAATLLPASQPRVSRVSES